MAITIRESCIEVLDNLIHQSDHTHECALRQPFSLKDDYFYPVCNCGNAEGLEYAWDLMAILKGEGA